ncbi:MAG TPA: hypothetical protein DCS93_02075 [Microscillaceae bacterium]|nr:hypothetical protein [Microscillaceae bacterium]
MKKTIITLVVLAGVAIGCVHKPSKSTQNTMTEIKFNQKTTLTGVYTKSIIAKRGAGEHRGHYKIVVNDTLEVNLLPPYEAAAVRSSEEVARFEGKQVTVTGLLEEDTSLSEPSIENEPLTVNTPCFATIESIALAEK